MLSVAVSLLLLPGALAAVGKDGVGRLPALGWNSWNAFNCKIDESRFMVAARKLVELGLRVWMCNPDCGLCSQHLRMSDTSMLTSTTAGL